MCTTARRPCTVSGDRRGDERLEGIGSANSRLRGGEPRRKRPNPRSAHSAEYAEPTQSLADLGATALAVQRLADPSHNLITDQTRIVHRVAARARRAGAYGGRGLFSHGIAPPARRPGGSSARTGARSRPSKAHKLALTCDDAGAPEGIRTPGLLIRSQMLYPLSYRRTAPTGRPKVTRPGWGWGNPRTATHRPPTRERNGGPGRTRSHQLRSAEAEGFEPSMGL